MFGTTPTQVIRDLEVLQFCGLPGGYYDDLFDVDIDGVREDGHVFFRNAEVLARPLRLRPFSAWDPRTLSTTVRDLDEVSCLVAEIESEQKAVPILLKQYLKLGAQLIGFNVDPAFQDVLDGLMLVDLDSTDPRLSARFLGPEGYEKFRASRQKLRRG